MNKIETPMDKEVRGFVMLMLMRSYEPDSTQTYDDKDRYEYEYTPSKEDNQISYVIGMID